MKLLSTAGTESPPIVAQGSHSPVFEGDGPADFGCTRCGKLLIRGYWPHSFAAVCIECISCSAVSCTPAWPEGEPLPENFMTLGKSGIFRINGPVRVPRSVLVTCDAELDRARTVAAALPLSPDPNTEDLRGMVDSLRLQITILSGCQLQRAIESEKRAQAAHRREPLNLLAWSILAVEGQAERRSLELQGPGGFALDNLIRLRSLLERWARHPRIAVVARSVCHDMPHTLAALAFADHMHRAGLQVNFTDDLDGVGGRSADMYGYVDPETRYAIEVKAPKSLCWPATAPTRDCLVSRLKKASREVSEQRAGADAVLVFAVTHPAHDLKALVDSALLEALERRQISSSIAVVAVACSSGQPTLSPNAGREYPAVGFHTDFVVRTNPRYVGSIEWHVVGPSAPA